MSQANLAKAGKINILFTCIGRRVSLLRSFARAAARLKLKPCLIGTDITPLSPALQLCDKRFIVRQVNHKSYLKSIRQIIKDNNVDLLVPTVDLDLKILAENRDRFSGLGCHTLISTPQVVGICQDKRKTYRFLTKNG